MGAMRLMEMSKDSLTLGLEDRPGRTKTVMDRIYDVIREMVPIGSQATLKVGEIKERYTSKGFKPDQIDDAIAEYERLNIFHVNDARTKITFVDANKKIFLSSYFFNKLATFTVFKKK